MRRPWSLGVWEVRDPFLGDSLSRATAEAAAAAGESNRRCPALERRQSVYGSCRPGSTLRLGIEVCSQALLACPSEAAGAFCGSLLFGSLSLLRDCGTERMAPTKLLLLCCCLLAFPPPGTGIFSYATYSMHWFIVVLID